MLATKKSFAKGVCLVDLKIAKIISIFRSGSTNYRPVLLGVVIRIGSFSVQTPPQNPVDHTRDLTSIRGSW